MKYYKFVGTEQDAVDYHDKSLVIANIYREDDLVGGEPVKTFATDDYFPDIMAEWKEVTLVDYDLVGKKGIEAVCVANVIKYLWRYEEKGKPLQDVQKAKWYLEKLLNEIKDEK